MADNFLEKQMEQYRSGKSVIRRVNPSLDSLLHKLAEQDSVTAQNGAAAGIRVETDPALIVKKAQLDAALRSARILFGDGFAAVVSEKEQSISIDDNSCQNMIDGIVLAVRLKAAELGLRTIATKNIDGNTTVIHFCRI